MKPMRLTAIALLAAGLAACHSATSTEPEFGAVKGVVRESAGAPIANVSLQIWKEGRTARQARSDAGGAFAFDRLEPGTWQLEFTIPSTHTLPAIQKNPAAVQVEASKTVEVSVSLARKSLPPPGPPGPGGPS